MFRTTLVALAFALLIAPAGAITYKWTDANGRVVYSDMPPTGNVKYETIGAPPPPANPKAVQDLAAKDLELKKRQFDAAERDKKAEAERTEYIKKVEQCNRAESNVRQLAAETTALIRYNEKGEPFVVDEATRRRDRAQVEAYIRQNCTDIVKN
ncbi:MAG: DUF4124 domain-containing protein [Burkholderiales bacterium]